MSGFATALVDADATASITRAVRGRLLLAAAALIALAAGGAWAGERHGLYGSAGALGAFAAAMLALFALVGRRAVGMLERADARRRAVEAGYRQLVEELPLVVYIDEVSDNSANIYTSPQAEELFGYTVEEWTSNPDLFVNIVHEEDRERVLAEVHAANEAGQPFASEYRLVARDGRVVWVRDEASLHRSKDGAAACWQGYLIDITRRRLAEEELRTLAVTDPLTALPNRRRLLERLRAAAAGGERQSLLFLDIDDFKTFNDSLGHRAGDALLVEVAARLARSAGADGLVARLGGDEFAVATSITDRVRLEGLGRRLLNELAAPVVADGRELWLTASIGIATGETDEELLREADLAMYRAKAQGGGTVAFYAPHLHASAERRLRLSADLRTAELPDQLELVYQPTFDLRDGSVEGLEALLRWRHPELGAVPPSEFVPVAEEQGSIVEIGRFALDAACRQAAAWTAQHGAFALSVNVSGRQLRDPAFADDVRAILHAHGIDPALLRLELTETVLVQANDTARRSVDAVCEAGVQLAIDDFGTGNSWIGHLQEFHPQLIKIDRSLLAGVESGETRLLRGTIALARELGVRVAAEGIEELAQLQAVRECGCDIGQGFLLGRPVGPAEAGSLLAQESRPPASRLRLA